MTMIYKIVNLLTIYFHFTSANITTLISKDSEDLKQDFIVEIIQQNYKNKNGWHVTLLVGYYPDELYKKLQNVGSLVTTNTHKDDHEVEDAVNYYPNTVLIDCKHFEEFEAAFLKVKNGPYWHPHSNIMIIFQSDNELIIAKVFYILWFYKVCNSIMLRYDDSRQAYLISYYSGYITEYYQLEKQFGCWKVTNLGIVVSGFQQEFYCENDCFNATSDAKLRFNKGAICLGYGTHIVGLDELEKLKSLNLFEDKGRNIHEYSLTAYVTEVLPFTQLTDTGNGSYILGGRDGYLWHVLSVLMNFTLDFSVNKGLAKQEFNYETAITHIFNVARGKVDVFLLPIYLMDLVIVEVDMTQQFKDSGVCFVAHRADFVTVLFDIKLLMENYTLFFEYVFCLLSLWIGLFLFSIVERGQFSLDQAGKDLLNTIRNMLSIPLLKPPRKRAGRLLLTVSIWGFFVVNFVTQAAIISFFTAFKRGQDVNTFEDIIEKGYDIYGMASPDVILPEEDERFIKLNSKLVPTKNMLSCTEWLKNDTEIFCLVECSVAKYVERNQLNSKGEQYLHVSQDRIHNRYLNMILQKHSPLTNQFNKIVLTLVESGIIKKWEEYRFKDIKEEVPLKPLSMVDLIGIFEGVGFLYGLCLTVFFVEVFIWMYELASRNVRERYSRWKRSHEIRKALDLARSLKKIKHANVGTQTRG